MFIVDDRVLVLLPIPGEPLRAKFCGPYTIDKKVSDVDYIVSTPDMRKVMRMCHVKMLKDYQVRDDTKPVLNQNIVTSDAYDDNENPRDHFVLNYIGCDIRLETADGLSNLEPKVSHLEPSQQNELVALLKEFEYLFGDEPGKTDLTCHDVDVGQARPTKQQPYRLNPHKLKLVRKEIKYMLDHKIIKPSQSEWRSPVILVPKPDN